MEATIHPMTDNVFDKTDKGREEIATRVHHLAPRLRTLLLLVDGKRDTVELMAKVGGLGLDEKSLVELLEGGFIQVGAGAVPDAPAAPSAPAASVTPAAPLPPQAAAPVAAAPAAAAAAASAIPAATAAATATAAASAEQILREGETPFQALYNFFNETIRSSIGLRGYGLQLKVERCSTINDFRELRQPYLDAVLKAKGPELERSLRNRLDQLLSLG